MTLFCGDNLTCVRGDRTVFRGLDFSINPGELLVLSGRNGSGKSSLLRLMAGLSRPAAGTLRWQGADIGKDPETHNARLHYIGHADAVKPAMSVIENLAFWAALRGGSHNPRERAARALDALGMAGLKDTPARFLSAGQRRRAALARILAAPATLWLLDEPGTALDKETQDTLERLIDEHRQHGGMVVLSTHAPPAAQHTQILDLTSFADTGAAGAAA